MHQMILKKKRIKTSYCPSTSIKSLKHISERKEIEKYSHVASLNEIKDNDYNLIFPDMLDTFRRKKQIDLNQVRSKLIEVDYEIMKLQKRLISI